VLSSPPPGVSVPTTGVAADRATPVVPLSPEEREYINVQASGGARDKGGERRQRDYRVQHRTRPQVLDRLIERGEGQKPPHSPVYSMGPLSRA
jgi:hypothetical protein